MANRRVPMAALRAFELEGVRETGKTVGDGSYATVKELDFRGLKCVGKKIHAILYNSASPQEKVAMLGRFESECELLSRLHHPCVVQFLGVCFERDSQLPVIVMEYLHTTLAACLDKGVLQEQINYEILLDVVLGLRYLHEHSPPIVHRDLSANNVLLTPNMSAKISDLGVAKILNLSPVQMGQMTQTQTPGTPCYMPPEAMVARPKYTNKVDIFSFGVMMVHVISAQWPIPGEAFREDPNVPDLNIPLSEFERRAEYLQGISQDHPLMGLIRQCLNNMQSRRPDAAVIHEQIKSIVARFAPSFSNRSEMLQRISCLTEQVDTLTRRVQLLGTDVTAPREEATSMHGENESLRAQVQSLQAEVKRLSVRKEECQPHSTESKQSLVLSPRSKLKWKRCEDMFISMAFPHVVRINNDIYAGGGYSKTHAYSVFKYNPADDTWSALPRCPTSMSGLTELNGKPVLVGGAESNTGAKSISDVYILEDSQEWRKSLPPLPTARYYMAVIHYQSFLIVCGGVTSLTDRGIRTYTTAVEVFSSETSLWYKAEPLPIKLCSMSYTVINGTCYLIGGAVEGRLTNRAFCAFLPSLIEQAITQADPRSPTASQSSSPPSAIWRELTECPCYCSAAARLGDCLLAIGGRLPGSTLGTMMVHLYSPDTKWWQRMPSSDIPKPLYAASATQLASGDVILIGGKTRDGELSNTVIVGTVDN